ncbi:tetratricopeptide repeat protein [Carboxylicivirga sediminis]|uniref:Tetratricopeptide repeat protein n=1 Tax=Carboxylicivirga sediminis TaxID=2006564 RepID=A0A941F239_9BACT|nr:tetratricopeptide repeat protein [Carboxylicivirga sediminis]MBR8534894.1 tetratricopeptide repeat protein [Carboxylicivirga sediminis]
MMRKIALLLFVAFVHLTYAQQSLKFDSKNKLYEHGMEMYRLGKYGLARVHFNNFVKEGGADNATLIAEAAYLERICAQKLENDDVQYLWESYLAEYPYSNRLHYAKMHLGDYYKDKNKYRQATRWYDKVKPSALDKETQIDYYFASGYALFMQEEYDAALAKFNKIRGQKHEYSSSVQYYYAHIQYQKGNYETALNEFKKLEEERSFKKVIPFYVAQIYYLQEDYDSAIKYAEPLTDEGTRARQADMNRIIADAYYAQKDYAKAVVYYQKVIRLADKPMREDFYHLGFANYFIGEYEAAINGLSKVTSNEDVMAQNAYYHLGDCYLKSGDKKRARVAFEAASKYDFDKGIQEDALFNYIKLNYELAFSPFNEIINSFMRFIELFPESDRIDEAYEYLGKAFLTTKNYREALASMEKIQNKTGNVYKALQRVAYFRALELFTDSRFNEALEFFDYSLKYAEYDKKLKIGAYYWRGETYYRLGNYHKAIVDFREFIYQPGSYDMKEFPVAHYNIAYSYYKQKEYAEAQNWFRKYNNLTDGHDRVMLGDAYNRTADCYYVNRQFAQAISMYDKASTIPEGSPDYALFQKAFCLGLTKDYQGKISVLDDMVRRYPQSPYVDDALYEAGRSYVALSNNERAIYYYKSTKERYPKGSYAKKALLQLGLVYYNSNDNDNSLTFYKRVVNEYPGTSEAEDALLGIRNIYMDNNDLNGYMKYTASLGAFAQVGEREQDSLTFVSAERFYMQSDCERAIAHFKNYLTRFPEGKFVLNAHFYKADCQYKTGAYSDALSSFEYVAGRERSLFTEEALLRMGELMFQQGAYRKAYDSFSRLELEAEIVENRLEAKIGKMRCLAQIDQPQECIRAAENLLASPKVADEIKREAYYNMASSYLKLKDNEKALENYHKVAVNTKSAEGAESKYQIAQLMYDSGNQEAAEKEIFDYIDRGTSHQYWLARSFILLAEIYHDRGETFQAVQYLQSIKDNYEGDDDIEQRVDAYLNSWSPKDESADTGANNVG